MCKGKKISNAPYWTHFILFICTKTEVQKWQISFLWDIMCCVLFTCPQEWIWAVKWAFFPWTIIEKEAAIKWSIHCFCCQTPLRIVFVSSKFLSFGKSGGIIWLNYFVLFMSTGSHAINWLSFRITPVQLSYGSKTCECEDLFFHPEVSLVETVARFTHIKAANCYFYTQFVALLNQSRKKMC